MFPPTTTDYDRPPFLPRTFGRPERNMLPILKTMRARLTIRYYYTHYCENHRYQHEFLWHTRRAADK